MTKKEKIAFARERLKHLSEAEITHAIKMALWAEENTPKMLMSHISFMMETGKEIPFGKFADQTYKFFTQSDERAEEAIQIGFTDPRLISLDE